MNQATITQILKVRSAMAAKWVRIVSLGNARTKIIDTHYNTEINRALGKERTRQWGLYLELCERYDSMTGKAKVIQP